MAHRPKARKLSGGLPAELADGADSVWKSVHTVRDWFVANGLPFADAGPTHAMHVHGRWYRFKAGFDAWAVAHGVVNSRNEPHYARMREMGAELPNWRHDSPLDDIIDQVEAEANPRH